MAESNTPCIACKTPIPIGAIICKHCSSYQSKCKNRLRFYAGLAGAVALVVTAGVWVVTKIPEARRVMFWKDSIDVVSFIDGRQIVVANTGDGDVVLKSIQVWAEAEGERMSFSRGIDVLVEAGTVFTGNLGGQEPQLEILQLSDEPWATAAAAAFSGETECYVPIFHLEADEKILIPSEAIRPNIRHVERFTSGSERGRGRNSPGLLTRSFAARPSGIASTCT